MKRSIPLLLLLLASLGAQAGIIWPQNGALHSLFPNLDLNSVGGIVTGSVDPSSVATAGAPGTLYERSNGSIYVKTDSGTSTNWMLIPTWDGTTLSASLINVPATTSSTGKYEIGGTPVMHNYGKENMFGGVSAGNQTLTIPGGSCTVGFGCADTGFGYNALNAITSGEGNTGFGHVAGQAITSGHSNTCIGSEACQLLTTGNNNVAVGGLALATGVSTSASVALGEGALANATNSFNLAVGTSALFTLSTGQFNLAFGTGASQDATTATGTSSFGTSALTHVTTSSYSIGVGYQAGAGTNADTTGSYDVFLGYNTGFDTSTNFDNAVAIGKNATIGQANSMALGASNGTDNLKVGIGTATPAKTLDVNGVIAATGITLSTGATTGYVWTASNSSGDGGWQSTPTNTGIQQITGNGGTVTLTSASPGYIQVVNTTQGTTTETLKLPSTAALATGKLWTIENLMYTSIGAGTGTSVVVQNTGGTGVLTIPPAYRANFYVKDSSDHWLFDLHPVVDPSSNGMRIFNNQAPYQLVCDFQGGVCQNSSGTSSSLDWFGLRENDNSSVISHDWGARLFYDSAGRESFDYNSRTTLDASGVISFDGLNRALEGSSAHTMLDFSDPSLIQLFNPGYFGVVRVAAHLQLYHNDPATTAAVQSGAGVGGACSLVRGNDSAGQIEIDTGTGTGTGSYCELTFGNAFGSAPLCVLTPAGSPAASSVYVTSTTTTMDVNFDLAAVISSTYLLNYHCFEEQ